MQRFFLPIILTVLAASGWAVAYWQLANPAQSTAHISQPSPADDTNVDAGLPSMAPILRRVMPGVVNISARGVVDVRDPFFEDPFFRYLFAPNNPGTRQEAFSSLGSGVIVDAELGYVLTNHHVVDGANEITVILIDDRELPAQVIGSDKDSDIALLKISADELTAIPIAAPQKRTAVGDFMVAIGNPFGLKHSVTLGIISGLGRTAISGGYEDLIQTDAPINQGNSGGALVNMQGELVGINKAILSQTGGSVGIGFAIPINQAVDVMQQLAAYGEVRRGRLGVRGQTLNEELARAFGTNINAGVIVTGVRLGSAGQKAGLRRGDIIIGLNGKRVVDSQSLENAIGLSPVGEPITINVLRNDTETRLQTKLQAFVPEEIFGGDLRASLRGAMFGNAEDYRYPVQFGVMVTAVEPNSPAWNLGLETGDLLTILGDNRVGNLDDLETELLLANSAKPAQLLRNETRYQLVIP